MPTRLSLTISALLLLGLWLDSQGGMLAQLGHILGWVLAFVMGIVAATIIALYVIGWAVRGGR